MSENPPDFLSLLQALSGGNVDFIVIGGIGAVLQGAPVTTFDLDLVHSRSPENLARLLSVLNDFDAHYREQRAKRIEPTEELLSGAGHHLLMTTAGPLDLLGMAIGNRSYSDLLEHTISLEIAEGCFVRVLDLPMLIAIKEEIGRDKDLAVLPVLRRTLEEQRRNASE